jgi:phosphoribosyl 1,2-cyclic phosphodiesterase
MRLTSIASGSSGNCIYVGSEDTHILIDSGISGKRIEQGLQSIEVDPSELDGILITHEHTDHIQGLGVMARRYGVPIYATEKTGDYLKECSGVGCIDCGLFQTIIPEQNFKIGDFTIDAHRIWHDAVDPVCYTIQQDDTKASIATDLGDYNTELIDQLKECDILFIEANHDSRMLEVGPYPYQLKKRIMGQFGHLSNDRCGDLINQLYSERLKHVFLGHLSKENNFPALAYETVKLALNQNNESILRQIQLQVANRDTISAVAVAR